MEKCLAHFFDSNLCSAEPRRQAREAINLADLFWAPLFTKLAQLSLVRANSLGFLLPFFHKLR
jgi:hypothetical protein